MAKLYVAWCKYLSGAYVTPHEPRTNLLGYEHCIMMFDLLGCI